MAGSVSVLGVGSGLDLQGIIDKLRAADQGPIDKKKTSINAFKEQINEFTTVNNKLLSLKSAALDLSLSGTFLGRTVSSSAENTVSATVADGATVRSTAVTVGNLAAKSSFMATTGLAKTTDVVTASEQPLAIKVGTTTRTLTVAAGTTLSQLVDQINNDSSNPGVTASIINDGVDAAAPYKLVLTAKVSGESNRMTITTPLPDLPMAVSASQVAANSLNAQFTVDGVSYQRQSNVIDDVFSGVTLTMKSTGTASIAVAADSAGLQEKIVKLVTLYNEVNQEIQGKIGYDATTKAFGMLANTGVRELPFDLQNLMNSSNKADSTGAVTSLADLGLEVDRDGVISINQTTLAAKIAAAPDAISAFFTGDTTRDIEGFGDKVNNRLRVLTSGTGLLAAEKDAANAKISDINLQIEGATARLDKKYEAMSKQFNVLDQFMSKMTSVGSYLTSQFNALSGTSDKNK